MMKAPAWKDYVIGDFSRSSSLWLNTRTAGSVDFHFLGFHGHIFPLGMLLLALLVATVLGLIIGTSIRRSNRRAVKKR